MSDLQTISLLSLGPIGDAILTTPLVSRLAEHYPEAAISIICSPRNREVHELNRAVSEIIVLRNSPAGLLDALDLIRRRRWDLYIDPKDHASTTSRLLATFLRYETALVHPGNLSFLRETLLIPPADGPHFVDGVVAPLLALEVDPPSSRRPVLPDSPVDVDFRKPGILLNLSAGSPDRYWPVEHWIELTEKLGDVAGGSADGRVTVVAAPSDAGLAERVAAESDGEYRPTATLSELYRIVDHAEMIVTPDTSVVHIASGYNRPIVALFSSEEQNQRRFAPLSDRARSVQPAAAGAGIGAIEPARVQEACIDLLGELRSTDQKSAPSEM